MQKYFSPKEGAGGARDEFPKGAGVVFEGRRRDFRHILVVSANPFVSSCVNEWAEWREAIVKAVPGFAEAEALVRGQGKRIGLLVLDLNPEESMKLLDLARRENPQIHALVMLPPVRNGVAADKEAMRPFTEKEAAVIAEGDVLGKEPAFDAIYIVAALGSLEGGPKTGDVSPVSSPA